METEDTMMQLLQLTSRLSTQIESLDKRMAQIENVVTNDVRQDQRLMEIEKSLGRGNQKFIEIEKRINKLEDAEGDKAKGWLHTFTNYILTGALTFVGTCIIFYITNKK